MTLLFEFSNLTIKSLMVHLPQVKGKYEEIAMKIKYYVERKHEDWMAETERNLPLMIKMPLLIMKDREGQLNAELVCITCQSFFLFFLCTELTEAEY